MVAEKSSNLNVMTLNYETWHGFSDKEPRRSKDTTPVGVAARDRRGDLCSGTLHV
jgi:hypothetical protein